MIEQRDHVQATFDLTELGRFLPLQEIICCPRTKTPLTLLPLADLKRRLSHEEKKRIPPGTIGAFVSEGSLFAYPIIGRIPNLLQESALKMNQGEKTHVSPCHSEAFQIKKDVQKWYDEYGWKRNVTGTFNDTALFSQTGKTGHAFYELASHLSFLDRFLEGDFLLDAGSGPIAHLEYLSYSWFYKYRVCVDLSLTALQEATFRVRDRDFCCLADTCRLPFFDNAFCGVISGYTIQHIPELEQCKAIRELYRVLKPGNHLCMMTEMNNQSNRTLRRIMFVLLRMLGSVVPKLNRELSDPIFGNNSSDGRTPPFSLYCFLRDLEWWDRAARQLTPSFSIETLRLLAKPEFESLYGSSLDAAKFLRRIESLFSRFLSKISRYALIDLYKNHDQKM